MIAHLGTQPPQHLMEGQKGCSKQPRRFLEHINDNFLTQVVTDLLREGVLLDLIFTGKPLR